MKYCRKLARLNNITYASSYLITVCLIMQRSSSSSFEVSAIFGMVILMTLPLEILLVPLWFTQSLVFSEYQLFAGGH